MSCRNQIPPLAPQHDSRRSRLSGRGALPRCGAGGDLSDDPITLGNLLACVAIVLLLAMAVLA